MGGECALRTPQTVLLRGADISEASAGVVLRGSALRARARGVCAAVPVHSAGADFRRRWTRRRRTVPAGGLNFKSLEGVCLSLIVSEREPRRGEAATRPAFSIRHPQDEVHAMPTAPSIAGTLTPDADAVGVAWIADLDRASLRAHRRDGLALELVYAPDAAPQVRELIQRARDCCAFLRFVPSEAADAVRMRIEAPAKAHDAADAADALFARFLAGAVAERVAGVPGAPHSGDPAARTAPADSESTCAGVASACAGRTVGPSDARETTLRFPREGGRRPAGVVPGRRAAATVACVVCCVLPFALPAVALTALGGVVAALAGVPRWALGLAVVTTAGGWLWVGWKRLRTRLRPAPARCALWEWPR